MITDFYGVIVQFVWGLLTLELAIDGFKFQIWMFYAFLFLMVFFFKLVVNSGEKGGK